jgi:WD40 repeat protein
MIRAAGCGAMDGPALFLSYNSVDRPSVVAFQKLLAERRITTFLDRDQLAPGLPWPKALEDGLRGVRAVAVFIGRELGGWQKREMYFALDRQVREEKQGHSFPVIPVLLAGADLRPGFLFLNTWIDLRGGLDSIAVAEPLQAFERAFAAVTPATASAVDRSVALCPYRGLEAFREEHAAFFAGRTAFARQLFDFTLGKELVAVVGPSGSGKSSVVQAGLVPLLRRQVAPATTWDVVTFAPGSDPFQRFASCLAPLLEPDLSETDRLAEAEKLGKLLASGDVRLESVIDRVIDKSNGTGRLLVIADQFEELFTLTPEPKRRPFARTMLDALGNARFTLLVTLRADFYGHIITLDRELSDHLAPAQVNIGGLTGDELRESITAPARLVGLEFEPGLADRILHDVGGEPGNLPLLEFALTSLWAKRQGRSLTNAGYDDIGGVTGALTQRAEAEFARFGPEEQTAARRLLTRLVRVARPEEGAEDTRQRIDLQAGDSIAEKVALALAGPETRLLVMGRPEGEVRDGRQTVEMAHEALIRNWGRLRGWLNEDREFLLWQQRMQMQVEQWEQHGREGSYLLRGVSLSEAERRLVDRPQDLTSAERVFIGDSVALREREREYKERRRKLGWAIVTLSMLAAFALAVTFYVLYGNAQRNARESKAQELAALSTESLGNDPEKSILLGVQAVNATLRFGQPPVTAAEAALHQAILSSQVRMTLRGHSDIVTSVAFSPDGKRLATGSEDHTAKVWDTASGKELLTLRGHSGGVYGVAFSPDGKRLATASEDHTAKVWDAESSKELLTLRGHSSGVESVAFSPDGKRLATASRDRTAKVWDAESGKELLTLHGHSDRVNSVAFSRDGKRLATASKDQTARVWDAESSKELLTLFPRGNVTGVAFSADGKRLATASEYGAAKVWDAESGKELLSLRGHSDTVTSVAFSSDGKRLATASDDDTAKTWYAESGEELLTLRGHSGIVTSVAFSPDGKRLATASWDQTAKLWDAENSKELLTLHSQGSGVRSLAVSNDGKYLATAGYFMATVWDAESGRQLWAGRGHSRGANSVAFSPDGERLATVTLDDHTATVWDAESGKESVTLRGHSGDVDSVAFSPDGKRLATAGEDHTAKVWDAKSGRELLTLRGHSGDVDSVAFSPDGKRLATASWDNTAKVWDTASGKDLLTLHGHSSGLDSVAFSPDGKRLATASWDRTAAVWDTETGEELLALRGHSGDVTSVAFSPDGKHLATASADGTAKLWDAESGKDLLTLRGLGPVYSVAFSPDGKRLATVSGETVQVYALDVHELLNLARSHLTRSLTAEECEQYFGSKTCPPLP